MLEQELNFMLAKYFGELSAPKHLPDAELLIKRHLIPLKDWPKYHDWPTESGLRSLIARKKTNGFNHAVVKIGKRVLIDEEKFFEWVEWKKVQ